MRREDNPRWRLILEERWQDRLHLVTELSLAYHSASAEADAEGAGGRPSVEATRRLLSQAVAARRRLADTEDALGRIAAGGFGHCEQCQAPIQDALLAASPEVRYCADCVAAVGVTAAGGTVGALAERVPAQRLAAAR
jgi:RNA polymerase-binding transcription factor DksA